MDFFAFRSFILVNHVLTDGLSGRGAARMVDNQGSVPPLDSTDELTTASLQHRPDKEWAHHLIVLVLDDVTVPHI